MGVIEVERESGTWIHYYAYKVYLRVNMGGVFLIKHFEAMFVVTILQRSAVVHVALILHQLASVIRKHLTARQGTQLLRRW